MDRSRPRLHEFAAIGTLSATWGVVNVEFLSVSYLAPFLESGLKLTNSQFGILVSAFWAVFGLSSYVTGTISDRIGKRRELLVGFLLAFSAASVLSGFSRSFLTLLAARLLMGLLEGPILPLLQALVVLETPVQRRGLNMGIVQTFGAGLMVAFAPFLLVGIAHQFGWRSGFFVVAIPGLVCALALRAIFAGEPSSVASRQDEAPQLDNELADSRRLVLRSKNIWLCCALSVLYMIYFLTAASYLPLYYMHVDHLKAADMSALMSSVGAAGIIMGVSIPAIADRIGRKKTAVISGAVGILCPLAALLYVGPIWVMWLLMFIGLAPVGVSILAMATIPSESVPARAVATAIGLSVAVGTVIGGGAGPTIAGWIADRTSLRGTLVFQLACAVLMALLAMALHETWSGKHKKRDAEVVPHPEISG